MKRFETEEEKQEKKESEKKKTQNERLIKDKIIRGSGHFLSKKKIIINLKEKVVSGIIITLNTKVMVIKTATYP